MGRPRKEVVTEETPRVANRRRRATQEIQVKVGQIGHRTVELTLAEGAVIEEALDAAGFSGGAGSRIRLNGETAELDTVLESGDLVTVAGKVEGGN